MHNNHPKWQTPYWNGSLYKYISTICKSFILTKHRDYWYCSPSACAKVWEPCKTCRLQAAKNDQGGLRIDHLQDLNGMSLRPLLEIGNDKKSRSLLRHNSSWIVRLQYYFLVVYLVYRWAQQWRKNRRPWWTYRTHAARMRPKDQFFFTTIINHDEKYSSSEIQQEAPKKRLLQAVPPVPCVSTGPLLVESRSSVNPTKINSLAVSIPIPISSIQSLQSSTHQRYMADIGQLFGTYFGWNKRIDMKKTEIWNFNKANFVYGLVVFKIEVKTPSQEMFKVNHFKIEFTA